MIMEVIYIYLDACGEVGRLIGLVIGAFSLGVTVALLAVVIIFITNAFFKEVTK